MLILGPFDRLTAIGAVQASVTHDADTGSSTNPLHTTTMQLDALGQLTGADVNDGVARDVSYVLDEGGQVLRRDESRTGSPAQAAPHEVFYRFAGREMGTTGNDGADPSNYRQSNALRGEARAPVTSANAGLFADGTYSGSEAHADFALGVTGYTGFGQGSVAGSYTVRGGESLSAIATSLYGDANLWYKLAEANGIAADTPLIAGRVLRLPAGVTRTAHNAATLRPYDPADTIGDLSPTTPKPPKKAKCGVLGAILLTVIAVAVATIVTAGTVSALTGAKLGSVLTAMTGGAAATTASGAAIGAGAWIAGGAVGGAIGSAVSQGVGVATGIQDKFSWKGVGLAALGGAVGGALGPGGVFGDGGVFGAANSAGDIVAKGALASVKSGVIRAGLNGIVGSAVYQGIAKVTGLQKSFSWAGVAAAGVAAGVGYVTGKVIGVKPLGETRSPRNVAAHALNGAARSIANAATRSAIEGSSFGDNVMAALPDTLAQTVGSLFSATLTGPSTVSQNKQFLQALGLNGEEIREVMGAIGSIHPDSLRSIANAGNEPTNDEVARFLVDRLESWEADIAMGFRTGVSIDDFRDFKRRVAFHLIAADAYKAEDAEHILPSGYSRIPQTQLNHWRLTRDLLVDEASGFSSTIYFDANGSAIVAFRGTEPTDLGDIKTDIYQHVGLRAAQYEYLYRNIDVIVSRLSSAIGPNISFTGHSLGGGLATLAGLLSGRPTFAIAPAPLHQKSLDRYNITQDMIGRANIQYAAVLGEPLQSTGRNWAERHDNKGFISNATLGVLQGKTFFFGDRVKSYPATLEKDGTVSPSITLRLGTDPLTSHSAIHNGLSSFYTGATELGLGASPWFWDWNIYGD